MIDAELSDGGLLLLEIERLPITKEAQSLVLALLNRAAGTRLYIKKVGPRKEAAIRFALRAMNSGDSVLTIKKRLVKSGHCNSIATATRRVNEALERRGREYAKQMEGFFNKQTDCQINSDSNLRTDSEHHFLGKRDMKYHHFFRANPASKPRALLVKRAPCTTLEEFQKLMPGDFAEEGIDANYWPLHQGFRFYRCETGELIGLAP